MASRINTVLLCLILILEIYSLVHRPHQQVGRFQWLDTPGKQLGFDTKTGQRCWVWSDAPTPPQGDVRLCSDLAARD